MPVNDSQSLTPAAGPLAGRWRRLTGIVLAVGLISSAGAWGFSCLMPSVLAETGRVTVALAYVAFMLRTFALQAGIAMLAWGACALVARRWRLAMISLAMSMAWVHADVWQLARPLDAPVADDRAAITVMSANVLYGRSDPARVLAEALACDADVIVIQEYHPMIAAKLRAALIERWPFAVEKPQDDAFGQAVFSRLPFIGEVLTKPRGVPDASDAWMDPHMQARVEVGGRVVTITNVHLYPPVIGGVKLQMRQALELSTAAKETWAGDGTLHIVAGDFNCVPDGHHVQAMLEAGFIDSWRAVRRTRGTTWSAIGLKRYLAPIRIDHLLHGPGLRCVAAGVGGETGSDHLPTWARYAVTSQAPDGGADPRPRP